MTALNCRTAILTYTRGRAQLALSQKSRARTVHLPFAKMIDSSHPDSKMQDRVVRMQSFMKQ